MIAPSTPIDATLKQLGLALDTPPSCRTAGDLLVVLERKEIEVDAKTAKKIKESIG